jgi:hypothetical protein
MRQRRIGQGMQPIDTVADSAAAYALRPVIGSKEGRGDGALVTDKSQCRIEFGSPHAEKTSRAARSFALAGYRNPDRVRLTSLTLSCTAKAHVPKPRGAAVAMCAPRLAAREK